MRTWIALAAATLLAAGLTAAPSARAADTDAKVTPVFTAKLPNVPGKSLTAVLVSYGPGGKTPAHRHAGSVFAYVLSGAIRSEVSAAGPASAEPCGVGRSDGAAEP